MEVNCLLPLHVIDIEILAILGTYKYGGASYEVSASPTGADVDSCRAFTSMALKVNETCTHMQCSFGGVWNGGRGDGQKNLFVASFFFDRAAEVLSIMQLLLFCFFCLSHTFSWLNFDPCLLLLHIEKIISYYYKCNNVVV